MNTNVRIARASLVLITAGVCAHFLSLVKEIIVAGYFGITQVMDAFYAAVTLPTIVNNVLLCTFASVFIPIYIRARLRDKAEANRVAAVTINYLSILLVCGSLLLSLLAPLIIDYGFRGLAPETAAVAVTLLRIVSFTLIGSGLVGAMTGILNAHEHFLWPAFSNMLVTLTTILFIVFFINAWGICVLAYGLCAGLLAQFLFLIPVLRAKGYRHRLDFRSNLPEVREMLALSAIFFWVIIAAQVNTAVDRVMASYLAPGSIAALGYAGKLVQVPIVIFTGSLATALFPFFSIQVARHRIDEMKDSLAKSLRMSGFIFIPLTVMLVILSRPVIQVLFQRGAFDDRATDITSLVLTCYSLQLFFYTAGIILIRVFLAFQDMRLLVKVALAGVALNVFFNFLFIKFITPPAAGIALSTSFVQMIVMVILFLPLRRKIGSIHGSHIARGLAKIAVSAAVMGVVIHLITRLAPLAPVPPALRSLAFTTALAIVGGCLAFTGLVSAMRIEELKGVWRVVASAAGSMFGGQ